MHLNSFGEGFLLEYMQVMPTNINMAGHNRSRVTEKVVGASSNYPFPARSGVAATPFVLQGTTTIFQLAILISASVQKELPAPHFI